LPKEVNHGERTARAYNGGLGLWNPGGGRGREAKSHLSIFIQKRGQKLRI